jgi:CubicO group peptidase (beta-lactamase class C family)
MTKFTLLIAISFWTTGYVHSQRIIKGKVLELHSNTPISYVNIGILNSSVGTISNHDGTFLIKIPEGHRKDTVTFSALGFVRRHIPVQLLQENKIINIFLNQKAEILGEVIVSSKKEKRKEFDLGNRYYKGGLNMSSAEDATAGASVALLIQNKYPSFYEDLIYPVFLQDAKIRIADNTTGAFKIRVRLYDVDSLTGLPSNDLLNESIVLESQMKKGWLNFDLSKYNIQVSGPFFIAFEWILEEDERNALKEIYREFEKSYPERVGMDTTIVDGKKLAARHYINFLPGTSFGVSLIPFSLSNYQSFSRTNSLGEWKRAPFILSARVTVSNQPVADRGLSAQPEIADIKPCEDTPLVCEVRQLCRDFMEDFSVPGTQLTVSVNSKIVVSEGFGYSDIEKKAPVTTATCFRIGSISKSLTAAALLKLVAEKKLDLDVPVQNYVTSFPQKKYTVTTRQLAGHLGGIRHYGENELIRKEHYNNSLESISIFKDDSLLFKPGTQYHYSSFGWNLIGAIIEKVSKHNLLDYMYNNIWNPLGMMQTYGDVADSIMTDKSKFYYVTGEEAESYDLSYKYPSGGLISTTEDLVRFGNELLYGNYFDKALTKQLFETQFTSDNIPTNYGLGWNILEDRNGHRVWYHAGDLLESSGFLLIYPDDGIVIAFLANSRDGLSFDIQNIGELLYKNRIR